MNPNKVMRERLECFTDLPNIGPASAKDFALLGFTHPRELAGADPRQLYGTLCRLSGLRHDPCVLDVFMSVADFLEGNAPRPWWQFTQLRKHRYGDLRDLEVGAAANNLSGQGPLRSLKGQPGHR